MNIYHFLATQDDTRKIFIFFVSFPHYIHCLSVGGVENVASETPLFGLLSVVRSLVKGTTSDRGANESEKALDSFDK